MLPQSVQRLHELVPPRKEGQPFEWGVGKTPFERNFQVVFHMAHEAKRDAEIWGQAEKSGGSGQPALSGGLFGKYLERFLQAYSPSAQVERESRLGQIGPYFQEIEESLHDASLENPRVRLFVGLARKIHEGEQLTDVEWRKVRREIGALLAVRFKAGLHRLAGACVDLVAKTEKDGKLGRGHLEGLVEFLGAHKLAEKSVLAGYAKQAIILRPELLEAGFKSEIFREMGS